MLPTWHWSSNRGKEVWCFIVQKSLVVVWICLWCPYQCNLVFFLCLSINGKGHRGTTDNFITSFLHFSLFSSALWDLANSRPRFLLCSSAVRVTNIHRKMDVTRERINHTLELTEMLPSFKAAFNLVNTAVICAIPAWNPHQVHLSSSTWSFCPFTFISLLMPLVLFVINLVFSALISML